MNGEANEVQETVDHGGRSTRVEYYPSVSVEYVIQFILGSNLLMSQQWYPIDRMEGSFKCRSENITHFILALSMKI